MGVRSTGDGEFWDMLRAIEKKNIEQVERELAEERKAEERKKKREEERKKNYKYGR
ncbi:MAG: hypothetical protein Q4A45_03435 [Clostridia bacterium]|nr:hypothetical protein [Clostridia bacterium]